MNKSQWRIRNNSLGVDTHVRDMGANVFQQGATRVNEIILGEVSMIQPEPLFKQGMVSIRPTRGGQITAVAYPNAAIDPISRNLHGLYEGLIPGQMVAIGFANGNRHAPFVVNRYPYQAVGNTFKEAAYLNPLTQKGWNSQDTILGHFSGSYLRFGTFLPLPGSTQLLSITDLDIETKTNMRIKSAIKTEISSNIVSISGSTQIELNGNTDYAIKYNNMKTAFDTLRTDLNNFITVFNAHAHGNSGASPPATPGIPSVADMSNAQNAKVRF